jgi:hypothetical protein
VNCPTINPDGWRPPPLRWTEATSSPYTFGESFMQFPEDEDTMAASTRTVGEGADEHIEVYQHFRSIPDALVDEVAGIVDARKADPKRIERVSRRGIYEEAVSDLLEAIRRGEQFEVIAPVRVGKHVHFWMREDIVEELDAAAARLNHRKSSLFATALRRWLDRNP